MTALPRVQLLADFIVPAPVSASERQAVAASQRITGVVTPKAKDDESTKYRGKSVTVRWQPHVRCSRPMHHGDTVDDDRISVIAQTRSP
jgi:hypothetical protein